MGRIRRWRVGGGCERAEEEEGERVLCLMAVGGEGYMSRGIGGINGRGG